MSQPNQLPARQIAPDVWVAPQLTPAAMADAAAAGFRSVINNRPDFEHGPDQPANADIAAAATAAGLEYRHQPVDGGYHSPQDIQAAARILAELPRPVLMFCRSGARSAKLHAAALASG